MKSDMFDSTNGPFSVPSVATPRWLQAAGLGLVGGLFILFVSWALIVPANVGSAHGVSDDLWFIQILSRDYPELSMVTVVTGDKLNIIHAPASLASVDRSKLERLVAKHFPKRRTIISYWVDARDSAEDRQPQ